MSSRTLRPKWWQLYLVLPLLLALFIVEHGLNISVLGHQVAQIGIILLIYGFIYVWLKANRRALSHLDGEQNGGRIVVMRMPLMRLPDGHQAFQLPDSEIKGMLSDTFEIGYIDGVSFPVHEESKNESTNPH